MLLPAAISIYKVASVGGDPVLTYSHYAYSMSLFLIVFAAVAAPELVSRDLRHHTLPLYFSRPLRRSDYPLAKLLALATAIFLFEALPLIVMYLGTVASSTSGSGVWVRPRRSSPACSSPSPTGSRSRRSRCSSRPRPAAARSPPAPSRSFSWPPPRSRTYSSPWANTKSARRRLRLPRPALSPTRPVSAAVGRRAAVPPHLRV